MTKKKLLVEGDEDKLFFQALCSHLKLPKDIGIGPPISLGAGGQGKGNALNILPQLLAQQADGTVTRVAIVLDADYAATGGLGFKGTWTKVSEIFRTAGYSVSATAPRSPGGFIFSHSNGLPDAGAWIMPNNSSDGFFEHLIRQSIVPAENTLIGHAVTSVQSVNPQKFKPLHLPKAEIATYMAFQKNPGQGLAATVRDNLIDFNAGQLKLLIDWLEKLYR